MKVRELIARLKEMPQDLQVLHLWDGEARTGIEYVWLCRDKDFVITADENEVCYSTGTRPATAPDQRSDPYWNTSRMKTLEASQAVEPNKEQTK